MMTTKEKIIRKSIKEVSKKIKELNDIIWAKPGSIIIEARQEAQELLEKYRSVEERTSKTFLNKVSKLSEKEKRGFDLLEKQKNLPKLMDEEVSLQQELSELSTELYYIEQRKK